MSNRPVARSDYRRLAKVGLLACVAVAICCAESAQAQFAGGVYVDTDGAVRLRAKGRGGKLGKLRARQRRAKSSGSHLTYVSLPGMIAEARRHVEAGEAIPDAVRYLDGMVKLRYLFVYPDENDLVIAGRSEEWDATDPRRPVGVESGRPVLQLDDLVVALRQMGPGGRGAPFGCSIDLTQDQITRGVAAANRIGSVGAGRGYDQAARAIAQAAGPQTIRFFGVPPETRFGFVCLEADYLMKLLQLGELRSPVRKLKSRVSMMRRNEGLYSRWWFTINYEPLLVSEDGLAYEIRGQALQVDCSGSMTNNTVAASASAVKFAEQFTENFVDLADAIPAFADLWNLTDLGTLAALIRHDRLAEKCSLDLSWVRAEDAYVVPEVPVAKQVDTLVAMKVSGRTLNFAVGGVTIDPGDVVAMENRRTDTTENLAGAAKRPTEGWSRRVERESAPRR